MTTQDLAKTLVFLLGLWLVPGALAEILRLPLYAETLGVTEAQIDPATRSLVYSALVLAFCNLVFVTRFVAAPGWWARSLLSGGRNVTLPRLGEQAVQELLFSLVGLVLLVLAATEAPRVVVEWYMQPDASIWEDRQRQFVQYLPQRAGLVVQTGLGIWLLLGTHGVVRFVRRWRTVEHRHDAA